MAGKRSRPAATNDDQVERVRDLCRFIEANRETPITLAALGRQAGLSPAYLQRLFKRVTGVTPRQYADACRLGHLKSILKERQNVTTALYEAGFGSSSRLYERAPAQLGMTPAAYRKGGRAAHIRFTIAGCPFGRVLLAATERGICAIQLGDRDADLETSLKAEYPAAHIERDDVQLQTWLTDLLHHLEGEPAPRLANGRAGDCIPATGVGGTAGHSLRQHTQLQRGCPEPWAGQKRSAPSPVPARRTRYA